MKTRKILITSLLVIALLFTGCNKQGNNEEELGEIKSPEVSNTKSDSEKAADNLLMKLPDGRVPNIYEGNAFQSITLGDTVDMDKLSQDDIVVGKGYFLSDKDARKYIEKEIKYVKGDINGMVNTYHQLLSQSNFTTVGVRLDEDGNLLINFTGFSPMAYVLNNPSFKEVYLDNSPGVRDVSFKDGAQEAVLKGYYKTIKANFPEVKYVYFQLGGTPWEAIKGEVHDGLLFMEPGQVRPDKAPEYLSNVIGENTNEETGFSDNYTGDRNLDSETEIVTQQSDFSEEPGSHEVEIEDEGIKVDDEEEEKKTKLGAPADEEGKDIFEDPEKTKEYIENLEEDDELEGLDDEEIRSIEGRPMTQEEIDEMNREEGIDVEDDYYDDEFDEDYDD